MQGTRKSRHAIQVPVLWAGAFTIAALISAWLVWAFLPGRPARRADKRLGEGIPPIYSTAFAKGRFFVKGVKSSQILRPGRYFIRNGNGYFQITIRASPSKPGVVKSLIMYSATGVPGCGWQPWFTFGYWNKTVFGCPATIVFSGTNMFVDLGIHGRFSMKNKRGGQYIRVAGRWLREAPDSSGSTVVADGRRYHFDTRNGCWITRGSNGAARPARNGTAAHH